MAATWMKKISVDKDVVTLLSKRTYENFSQALREVVSNAYDADATLVNIDIQPELDRIVVSDNGRGMTTEDFDYYLRIAARSRHPSRRSQTGRERIGQFGIGFLSIFPFCQTVEIWSTTAGDGRSFTATIDAAAYMTPSFQSVDISNIPVIGIERDDPELRRQHGTRISLIGLTAVAREYFKHRSDVSEKSILSWNWTERLEWELQQALPLEYRPGSNIGTLFSKATATPMEVRLNKRLLYRNDILHQVLLEASAEPITLSGGIRFKYAIVTPRTTVAPVEARGIQVRVKDVGIGAPTYFGLNIVGRLYAKLTWLAGEVHILSGLNDELTIDRNGFATGPGYSELREYFVEKLSSLATRVDKENSAIRDISDYLEGDMRRADVVPKREAIEQQVEKLRKTGYDIIVSEHPDPPEIAVAVDRDKKVVTVYESHPALFDKMRIGGVDYDVMFLSWNIAESEQPACRIEGRTIIINRTYPPFRDPKSGLAVRRLVACIEVGRSRGLSVNDLCRFVYSELLASH